MKRIILSTLVFLFCLAANGQRIDVQKTDTTKTAKSYEVEFIRDCLWHYQKQHNLSYMLSTIGTGIILINLNMTDNPKSLKYSNIAGGALMAIGAMLFIDAEKWMRKASIKPIPGGIAINIGKR